jgi:hypothetical protein
MNMETAVAALVVLVAIGLIAWPLYFNRPEQRSFVSEGEIRQEVDRYRAAIKSRTLCEKCLTANPARSNYCSDCGASV